LDFSQFASSNPNTFGSAGTAGTGSQCEVDPELYLDEVKWVSEVAEQDQRIQGIIGLATGKLGDLVGACYGKNSLRL
jgi:hypothetical protein